METGEFANCSFVLLADLRKVKNLRAGPPFLDILSARGPRTIERTASAGNRYFHPSDPSSRLDLRGFHAMNPARMGDTPCG